MDKVKKGTVAISLVSIVAIICVWMLDPIAQDTKYHLFYDQRTIFNIPNFWNVISNLPFLLVGVAGLYTIFRSRNLQLINDIKIAYILFFSGVSLVAFGSGYYHLSPGNASLVWDRLPMTIAFMALFSIIIAEFVSVHLGKLVLWPLIIFGVFSILYWQHTEARGEGDLRLYILVQFLPIMVIPLILLFFKSRFNYINGYWLLICAYVLAKLFEYFDEAIYTAIPLLSGHTIKHVVAAFGVYLLLKTYNKRNPVEV